MPIYVFRTEAGAELEEFYPVGQAPHLGEWTTIRGVACQRVIQSPQLANAKSGMADGPIVSESAPNRAMVEHWEGEARKYGIPMPARASGYDEKGRATFRNLSELQEYAKRDGRFVVGNPHEAFQDAARAPGRHDQAREKRLQAIDESLRAPEVI